MDYKGYTIKIEQDDDHESPREWDNLGTMVFWHKRCSLGDTTLGDAYGRPEKGKPFFQAMNDLKELLESGDVFYLPIYLYEHGGQTVSIHPFGDPWDSGQAGFIYVEKSKIREEWKVKHISPKLKAQVMKKLEGEVEAYDQWLTGDVWGYQIYGPNDPGCKDELDSCWGFFGHDYCEQEAQSMVDYYIKQAAGKAWSAVPACAVSD